MKPELRGSADVAVMQATDIRNRDDSAEGRRLDWSFVRCILVERKVSAGAVVVREVGGQNAPQVPLVEHDDVVEAFASHGADEPLCEGILPRALRRREDFVDSHAFDATPELLTVDVVTIEQKVTRRGLIGEGIYDLLGGPVGGGVLRHVEMNDTSAMVSQARQGRRVHASARWAR